MRVVYLNPIGETGGAEAALLNVLASLRDAKPHWNLHLVVAAEGSLAAKATSLGVTTHVLQFPASLTRLGDASAGGPAGDSVGRLALLRQLLLASFGIAVYVSRLRKLLRQLNPDIIHTNGFKMHLLGALAKRRDVPLIWHIHDYVHSRPVMARLMRLFRRRCSIALTNSNSVREDVRATCGDMLPVQTLYNGVDTTVFSPRGPSLDLDSLAGLPPTAQNTVKVGLLATFARWKGHHTFLRALSLLSADLRVRGYVIGGALYGTNGSQYSKDDLKAVAQDLGISDRVGFTDFVAEPAAAIRALDIVVHASTEPEPFGLVIAEGMACGRAVIASAAGGATEIIDAEVNALSHSPGDAARLAEQIVSLASNVELRQRLGQAGRATVQESFNRERLVKELAPIYSKLVQIEGKQNDTRVGAARPKSDDASINGSAGVAKTSGRFDSDRIRGLDSLRFVCAMWVVFVHCGFFPLLDHVDKTKFAGKLFAVLYNNAFNASAAVIVFFVISGFCINFPYAKGRPLHPKSYFTRRYIRIVTPMMVAILLARPLNIKLTLLSDSILWSLLAEEIYYVIYPLLLLTSRRIGWTKILVVAFVFSVGVILTNPGAGDYPSYGPQLNWLLGLPCWLLGCLLAQRVSSATASSVATASIWGWRMAAWGLSSFCSFLRFHSPVKHPWTLNLFAIFVYFWLTRETAYYKQHKAPSVLEHAGKWSYSIYLMHLHAQAIFVLLAFAPFAAGMNWMISIAFVLLVSYTFYLIVERPSHLFARRIAHKLLRPSLGQTQNPLSETVPERVADLTF